MEKYGIVGGKIKYRGYPFVKKFNISFYNFWYYNRYSNHVA